MDFSLMLVSDVMHEWDLGNWKDLFKFLIWLLFAAAPANVAIINEQYANCTLLDQMCTSLISKVDISLSQHLAMRQSAASVIMPLKPRIWLHATTKIYYR